jgi:hypothetical protein
MAAITEALLHTLGDKAAARPAALSLLIPDVSLVTRLSYRPDEPMDIAQVAMVATPEAGTKKVGSQVFETPEDFLLEEVGGVVLSKERQQWGIVITCLDWWFTSTRQRTMLGVVYLPLKMANGQYKS